MRTEVIRGDFKRLAPARDPFLKWPVDILESLFRGRVTGLAYVVKDAPRDRLLLGFIAEKRILQRYMLIGRIQAHRVSESVARCSVIPNFQQRVSKIFAACRS